jgi:hypothetical protein
MATSNRPPNSEEPKKPTIRAGRRRPRGEPPPGGRERAEAPRRDERPGGRAERPQAGASRPQSQAPRPSPFGAGPAAGGLGGLLGCLPSLLKGRGGIGILIVLALLYFFVLRPLLSGGGGESGLVAPDGGLGSVPAAPPATSAPLPTREPLPTRDPALAPAGSEDQTWLVMMYQDADDKILEKDIYLDLNEAERVGSTDRVQIVAQIDRYAGGYGDDGDWTGTRRYYVTRDDDLNRVGSELVEELDEQNMADGNTLVDFVTWAVSTYPADRMVLIMSDHGMGWPGGWSDPAPPTRGEGGTPLASALGNQIYLDELDEALQLARNQAGIEAFELIGMDACLMAQLEVYSMLASHARYAVASEETEPALGWAYAGFLSALVEDPGMSGADLGRHIVDTYIVEDQRIVDEAARADLLGRGAPMGSLFGGVPSSEQVASQLGRDITLSAVDLAAVNALVDRVNDLAAALQGADQRAVAQARNYAQSYTNIFGQQVPPAYIDLGHFAQLLQQANAGAGVNEAADAVLAAVQSSVVAEIHGQGKPGSTGVAIYFPNSQLYRAPAAGPASYNVIAGRFAGVSLWDDYLAYHYTGRAFDASAREPVAPAPEQAVAAPGQGEIQMTPLELSGTVARPGEPILLSTDITARNLGHILLFTGFYDPAANSLNVLDMDYLESEDTREVNGVFYPVWPDGGFTLEVEWEPLAFYISDGVDSVPALLVPQSYGAAPEDAVYTVDGVYTYTDGETRFARAYFRDGQLRQVYGFNGDPSASAPWEIHPEGGDRFTVLERWMDLDEQGRVVNQATEEGETLTFGEAMFTWSTLDAAPGDYVVGLIAEDLDGNKQQVYAQVTVE